MDHTECNGCMDGPYRVHWLYGWAIQSALVVWMGHIECTGCMDGPYRVNWLNGWAI